MKPKVTGMETKAITIRVTLEAASAYETAPTEQQRKLDALLSLKLAEAADAVNAVAFLSFLVRRG
ncbi:MAG: hypothetical protein M3461_06205 [Pseudomonadota bacterium]|nr:hypothetical protein [Pseudomonadota bacterium]